MCVPSLVESRGSFYKGLGCGTNKIVHLRTIMAYELFNERWIPNNGLYLWPACFFQTSHLWMPVSCVCGFCYKSKEDLQDKVLLAFNSMNLQFMQKLNDQNVLKSA